MSPETEGKIMVALIISLIAFGFGSGVGIVIGISQNDTSSPFSLNYTTEDQNPQMPVIIPESTDFQQREETRSSQNNYRSEEVYIPTTPDNTQNNRNNNDSEVNN